MFTSGFGEIEGVERPLGLAPESRAAGGVDREGLLEHVEVVAAVGAGHRVARRQFD